MTLSPPNPISDGHGGVRQFDRNRHSAFQELWGFYSAPQLIDLKATAMIMLSAGVSSFPELPPLDRAGRTTIEVARRQWRQITMNEAAVYGGRVGN